MVLKFSLKNNERKSKISFYNENIYKTKRIFI